MVQGLAQRSRMLGMCVAAFFLSQKMHRSVTTKILLPAMFLRCGTRKHTKLRNFDGYRCCATRRKKGTALHDGAGSSMVFQVTAELQTMPFDNSASTECPSLFFCQMCGRIGNEVPHNLGHEKRWVQLDMKTMETHILRRTRSPCLVTRQTFSNPLKHGYH